MKKSLHKKPTRAALAHTGNNIARRSGAFDSIPVVLEEIRQGRMVIVTDDEDRENDHGGRLRENGSDGRASTTTTARLNYS